MKSTYTISRTLAMLCTSIFMCLCGFTQQTEDLFFGFDNKVYDMEIEGNDLYVAGSFHKIGVKTGNLALFNHGEDKPVRGFPFIGSPRFENIRRDEIMDVVADNMGGWYICGSFTKAGNEKIANLAHINADYSIDRQFSVSGLTVEHSGQIRYLHLYNGFLYVLGDFTTPQGHSHILRINVSTKKVDNTWTPQVTKSVNFRGLDAYQNQLFVLGAYRINNTYTPGVGCIDINSGEVIVGSWSLDVDYLQSLGSIASCVVQDTLYLASTPSYGTNVTPAWGYHYGKGNVFDGKSDFPVSSGIGYYSTAIGDDNGGWYVSHSFQEVQGHVTYFLAHIKPDLKVDTLFTQTEKGRISELAGKDNDYIYVKNFRHQSEGKTYQVARFSRHTGEFDSNWIYDIDGQVNSIHVTNVSVFVTGHFNKIDGEERQYIASLSTKEKKVNPQTIELTSIPSRIIGNSKHIYIEHGNKVERFDFDGKKDETFNMVKSTAYSSSNNMIVNDSILVVFASFVSYTLNDLPASATGIYDIRNNTFHPVHQKFHSIKKKFSRYDSRVADFKLFFMNDYLIGSHASLDSINGRYQPQIFIMDCKTGDVLDFNPMPESAMMELAVSSDRFLAYHTSASHFKATMDYFIGINLKNNQFINKLPQINSIYNLDVFDNRILISGSFGSVPDMKNGGSIPSGNMAIMDSKTREITPFDLQFKGSSKSVSSAQIIGNTLYFAGGFTHVKGKERNKIAAVDITTKEVLDWDPNFNNQYSNFLLRTQNGQLMINGDFTMANTKDCAGIAKVNLLTEEIYDWGPDIIQANNYSYNVSNIEIDGDNLYASGYFKKMNETELSSMVALDKENGGILEDFKPKFTLDNGFGINNFLIEDDGIVVQGRFTEVNGAARMRIAKIDKTTGATLPFEFKLNNNGSTTVSSAEKLDNDYLLAGKYLNLPNADNNENYQLARIDGSTGEIISQIKLADKISAGDLIRKDSLVFFNTNQSNYKEPFKSAQCYSIEKDTLKDWFPNFRGNATDMLFSQSRVFITGHHLYESVLNQSGNYYYEKKDYTEIIVSDINNDTTFFQIPLLMGDNTATATKMIEWQNSLIVGGTFYRMGSSLKSGGITKVAIPAGMFKPDLTNFSPSVIGNKGSTRYTVYGKGFKSNTKVTLSNGSTSIPINGTYFEGDTKISGKIVLDNIPAGRYKLTVEIPGDTTMFLMDAITVEQAEAPDVWVNLTGPDQVTRGKPTSFYLNVGNKGNLDAYMVPLMIVTEEMPFEVKANWYEFPDADPALDIPTTITAGEAYGESPIKYISFFMIPILQANSSKAIKIKLVNGNSVSKGIEVFSFSPLYNELPSPNKSAFETETWGWDLFKCAWNFVPTPPGYACGKLILDQTVSLFDDPKEEGTSTKLIGGVDLATSVIGDCIGDINPVTKGVKLMYDMYKVTKNARDAESKFKDCVNFGKNFVKWAQGEVEPVWSQDPNDKYGPMGVDGSHYTRSDRPWSFTIMCENVDSALVAAQKVTITDTIDIEKFDISSFSLVAAGFGDTSISFDGNLKTSIDDIDLRPEKDIIVRIQNTLDEETGIAEWIFLALDPKTMELTEDVNGGFLPPNKNAPEGEGFVLFNISTKGSIDTGDTLRNKATIVFDWNEPIHTPEYYAYIDNILPESEVFDLPATVPSTFEVQWDGIDDGSGIAWYDVFVSKNDEPYQLWLSKTEDKRGSFSGIPGTSYSFYSVATDSAKNIEITPEIYDAKTTTAAGNNDPLVILEQDFDDDEWLPAGWELEYTNPDATWTLGNVDDSDFSSIDSSNVYSALCVYHETVEQNEILVSPAFTLWGDQSLLEFYAGFSSSWLDNAFMGLLASNDSENFVELWISEAEDEPWKFHKVQIDMSQFKGVENLKLYWFYYGLNGDIVAIDNIRLIDNYKVESKNAHAIDIELIVQPNPFDENTTISYKLAENTHVDLMLYDTTGKLIAILVNRMQEQGKHQIKLDARFNIAAGSYICKLKTKNAIQMIKLLKK